MDQTLDEVKKEADDRLKENLKKLTDDWLSNNIEDSSYAISVAKYDLLNQLEGKLLECGYQEYTSLITNTKLIIGYISSKDFTPKEEQQVKEKLREIKRIWNDYESNKAEKNQAVKEIVDKIEDLQMKILELVKG